MREIFKDLRWIMVSWVLDLALRIAPRDGDRTVLAGTINDFCKYQVSGMLAARKSRAR